MRPGRMLHVGPGLWRSWRCPRAWASEVFAVEAWRAYIWWRESQLALLHGSEPAAIVVEAVNIAAHAVGVTREALDDRRRQAQG